MTTAWDPAVVEANGFEDVMIVEVGQRASAALNSEDYQWAERRTDGSVCLHFGGLEITIEELLYLEQRP